MWRRVWWSATGFSTVALSRATIAKPTRLFALAPFAMGGGGKWYAVARGRKMGIFTSWPECQEQVKGFSAPVFKSFRSQDEAQAFMSLHNAGGGASTAGVASGESRRPAKVANAAKASPAGTGKRKGSALRSASPSTGNKRAAHTSTISSGSAQYLLRFDGGARGNPGAAGCGAVIWDPQGEKVWHAWWWLGSQTNNFAEATGLERGLEQVRALGITRLRVEGDSNLLINQLNGVYQVKNPALKLIHVQYKRLMEGLEEVCFSHIYREGNKDADQLANVAMDTRADGEEYFQDGEVVARN